MSLLIIFISIINLIKFNFWNETCSAGFTFANRHLPQTFSESVSSTTRHFWTNVVHLELVLFQIIRFDELLYLKIKILIIFFSEHTFTNIFNRT